MLKQKIDSLNNFLTPYRFLVEIIIAIFIIGVTISSCIATLSSRNATRSSAEATILSVNATNSIRDLESQLQKERNKLEISKNIALADNIITEEAINKIWVEKIITLVNDDNFRNSTEQISVRISKERLSQAKNEPTFGTIEIRAEMNLFSISTDLFNEDLEQITISVQTKDYKIKSERVGSIKNNRLHFFYDFVEPLIKHLEDYKNEQIKRLQSIS